MGALSRLSELGQAKLTARSLFVVFNQLPEDAQREFVSMLEESNHGQTYKNEEWTPLSEPTLKAIWDSPEEDYWDELYATLHAK